jgi:hypothetical protein
MEYMYLVPCAGAGMIALTIPPTHNNVPAKIHILHVQELVSRRNGEGYDTSSCTWSICILAGTLFCVGGMVRVMITAPAHGIYACWLIRYFVWAEW